MVRTTKFSRPFAGMASMKAKGSSGVFILTQHWARVARGTQRGGCKLRKEFSSNGRRAPLRNYPANDLSYRSRRQHLGERKNIRDIEMIQCSHSVAGVRKGAMSAILERPARERDLVKAFEVALDKAREFKYELERMKVTFSVSDDACTAYFEVVPEPGHLVLGGDLTVKIDLN